MPVQITERPTVICQKCRLTQFITKNGACRRCCALLDISKQDKPAVFTRIGITAETYRKARITMQMVADDQRLDEVAKILGINYWSLKNMMRKFYRELGVHSLSAAMAICFRKGIIQ